MNDKKASWARASTAPKTAHQYVVSNVASREWSKDILAPKETKKTKVNTVSYSGMTVIYRHGKK